MKQIIIYGAIIGIVFTNCIWLSRSLLSIRNIKGQMSTIQGEVKKVHKINRKQEKVNIDLLNKVKKLREVNKEQQDFIDKANQDMYGEMKIGENP